MGRIFDEKILKSYEKLFEILDKKIQMDKKVYSFL